jgi:hypothetical protein
MHQVVAALFVIACLPAGALAREQGGVAARQQRLDACSFLPRPLMEKVTPGPVNKYVFEMKPHGEPVGVAGSSCDYATTGLQIDPFARADEMRRNSPGKDWQPLTGVGDTAYFRNNGGRWAELMVWTGAHHFTIQMGVPNGSTAEAIKPNTVTLAHAIIDKLK